MKNSNGKGKCIGPSLKLCFIFALFLILGATPMNSAFAQVSVEAQFKEAVASLEPDARAEFIDLVRDPSQMGVSFEDFGIDREVADRLDDVVSSDRSIEPGENRGNVEQKEKLNNRGQGEKFDKVQRKEKLERVGQREKLERIERGERLDKVSRKLNKINDKLTRKLSNVKDHHARRADKVLQRGLKKAVKKAKKAVKVAAKAKKKADKKADKKDKKKGKGEKK